ncbi:MAG: GGDEF domain-containing protein [Methylobacter sp.]|nr:GGDEF domain-containing protein [Methylobacter sp.]
MDKYNIYNNLDTYGAEYANAGHEYLSQQHNPQDIINFNSPPTALSEKADLIKVIATQHQQLKAARQQIKALKETNAGLRQKLIRVVKKYAHTRYYGKHDELTGLPTRRLLLERLRQATVLDIQQQRHVALLFINLDRFKNVNDTVGYAAGDQLLQEIAQRLAAGVRHGDTACRYGGDEFVILLPDIEGREGAVAAAERIRSRLHGSYIIEGNDLKVAASTSISTSIVPVDGQFYSDLLKQGDVASYLAKAGNATITLNFQQDAQPHTTLDAE